MRPRVPPVNALKALKTARSERPRTRRMETRRKSRRRKRRRPSGTLAQASCPQSGRDQPGQGLRTRSAVMQSCMWTQAPLLREVKRGLRARTRSRPRWRTVPVCWGSRRRTTPARPTSTSWTVSRPSRWPTPSRPSTQRSRPVICWSVEESTCLGCRLGSHVADNSSPTCFGFCTRM